MAEVNIQHGSWRGFNFFFIILRRRACVQQAWRRRWQRVLRAKRNLFRLLRQQSQSRMLLLSLVLFHLPKDWATPRPYHRSITLLPIFFIFFIYNCARICEPCPLTFVFGYCHARFQPEASVTLLHSHLIFQPEVCTLSWVGNSQPYFLSGPQYNSFISGWNWQCVSACCLTQGRPGSKWLVWKAL